MNLFAAFTIITPLSIRAKHNLHVITERRIEHLPMPAF
jgi:hypothetical protein